MLAFSALFYDFLSLSQGSRPVKVSVVVLLPLPALFSKINNLLLVFASVFFLNDVPLCDCFEFLLTPAECVCIVIFKAVIGLIFVPFACSCAFQRSHASDLKSVSTVVFVFIGLRRPNEGTMS